MKKLMLGILVSLALVINAYASSNLCTQLANSTTTWFGPLTNTLQNGMITVAYNDVEYYCPAGDIWDCHFGNNNFKASPCVLSHNGSAATMTLKGMIHGMTVTTAKLTLLKASPNLLFVTLLNAPTQDNTVTNAIGVFTPYSS